jgi:hypothetical protein
VRLDRSAQAGIAFSVRAKRTNTLGIDSAPDGNDETIPVTIVNAPAAC